MKLAVYVPDSRPYPYVLTPDSIKPSLACEQEYGRLQLKGVVMLKDGLLPAIAHPISTEADFEYVIYSGYGMWAIETLIERGAEYRQSKLRRVALQNEMGLATMASRP